MSEKRYYVNCAGYLCDKDLSNTLSIFECADLLNRLAEENEQLKEKVKKLEELVTRTEEEKEHFADLILKRGFGNLFGKV